MPELSDSLTLRDYGRIVQRRKRIVIGATLIATLVAVVLSALQTPLYEARAKVRVQPRDGDALFDSGASSISRREIDTEIEVIKGQPVEMRVQSMLGLEEPPPDVEVVTVDQTDIIRISVVDANAQNAATLVNAYADAYAELRREEAVEDLISAANEVERTIAQVQAEFDAVERSDFTVRESLVGQLSSLKTTLNQLRVDAALRTGGVTVIQRAEAPKSPVEPTTLRNAVFAALAGLLVGLGAAFLVDYLDDTVRTAEDLEEITSHAVLVQVPVDPPPDDRPVSLSQPDHRAVEAYRGLRTNLQFLALDRSLSVVHVTSSIPGEGKTTTATNLAIVLARAGNRVAIVDADLRRPRVHQVLSLPMAPGLTELLLGAVPRDVVRHVDIGEGNTISVYTSGVVPSNPSEVLGSKRARVLLKEMGQHYDYVIVDSAPILPVSDSMSIAAAADGVLVVVDSGRTTTTNVAATLERLERVSAQFLGFVLNSAPIQGAEYSYERNAPAPEPVEPVETTEYEPADA